MKTGGDSRQIIINSPFVHAKHVSGGIIADRTDYIDSTLCTLQIGAFHDIHIYCVIVNMGIKAILFSFNLCSLCISSSLEHSYTPGAMVECNVWELTHPV